MGNSTLEGTPVQKSIKIVPSVLFLFALFCIAVVLVVGLAMGFGFCLSALVSSIDFGTATIIVFLAQLMILLGIVNFVRRVPDFPGRLGNVDRYDDSDNNIFVDELAEQLAETMQARSDLYEPVRQSRTTKRARRKTARS